MTLSIRRHMDFFRSYLCPTGGPEMEKKLEMSCFWPFFRVCHRFLKPLIIKYHLKPVFPENMVKVNTENDSGLNIKIPIQSHQGVKRLYFVKRNMKMSVLGNFGHLKYNENTKISIWNKVDHITS